MKKIFLFCICLLLAACGKESHSEFDKTVKMMSLSPDSSLMILENIEDEYSFMNEADKAYFGVLYFQALDKNRLPVKYNSKLEFSFKYYERTKQKCRLSYCYYYKARTFISKRDYVTATENLLKAMDLVSECKDASLSAKIFFYLGRISAYQLHYEESLDYYKNALTNFEKANESENIAKVYMMMNEIYMCLYKFDSAVNHGKYALKYTSDSVALGDIYNSIGATYYFSLNYDSAKYYIGKSLDYPYYGTNMSMRYYNMGRALYSSGNRDSSESFLDKAFEYPIDIYIEEETYTLLMKIAAEKNENEKIKPYMANLKRCQDSLYKLEQQTDIQIIKQIHESGKLTDEIKHHRLVLLAGAIFLFLIGMPTIYLLYQRGKQKQLTAERYKTKMEEKHEELEVINEELEEVNELLIKKHEQLEKTREIQICEINNELQNARIKYTKERRKADIEQREKITRVIYNEVLNVENEEIFVGKMNQILNNLPDKLLNRYPNITFKEILWCCLFILQISTPDILLILEYKQSSFYKFKQRLGNKLGFTAMKDLEQMLYQEIDS